MPAKTILVCQGTGCISGGAAQIEPALAAEISRHSLQDKLQIKHTGCHGFCQRGPLVVIEPEGTFYTHVTPADIPEIVAGLKNNAPPYSQLSQYPFLLQTEPYRAAQLRFYQPGEYR